MSRRRALDVAVSLGALTVFAPAQLAAAAAIRIEDGGPVLFQQERLGQGRRPFVILKLRTMRDGRVTRVGRYLRETGIDETLQFVCVLRGDMAIVGPRPLTAQDIDRFGWGGDETRFAVLPGVTGLAQIFGGDVSARHSRALDALYARRATPSLDGWIIGVSFAMVLLGRRRVRSWLRRRSKIPARATDGSRR